MQSKQDMKKFVTGLLNNKLSKFYYYHNTAHTLYVLDKVNEIGQQENCTAKEIDLLNTAAMWHDAGFINIYTGHEEEGCKLVRQFVPGYGYNSSDIDIICGMIMATKIPHSPKNKLEEIIVDADLEYLGTANAAVKAAALFKELHHINPSLTADEWVKVQIDFCKQHHYFTAYCKKNKEPQKLIYLNTLLKGDKKL
jgi:uncharacterized protein